MLLVLHLKVLNELKMMEIFFICILLEVTVLCFHLYL